MSTADESDSESLGIPSIVQSTSDLSYTVSPTDTRRPTRADMEELSTSFQSTDTVRRRPEPQSYGTQLLTALDGSPCPMGAAGLAWINRPLKLTKG